MLYSYLVATRKITLPVASDGMMNDENEEITRILNDMIQLITKEKYFIKEVHNTAVQFLINQEEEMKNEQEARKALEIEQTKKLAKVRMTKM